MHRTRRTAALLAGAALALSGCSSEDPAAPAEAPAGQAPAGGDDAPAAGGSAQAQPADVSGALATSTAKAIEPPGGELKIALLEARVVGQLLRVRLAYVPQFDVVETSAYELAGDQNPDPYLVDGKNLKRYSVVRTKARGKVESDVVLTKGSDEQPIVLTHYFAAPPSDVEQLSLSFAGAPWAGFDVTVAR